MYKKNSINKIKKIEIDNGKSENDYRNSRSLYKELVSLSDSDYYPFHMPGHKRQMIEDISPYAIDITEIDGFDNLQHPKGLIKNIENHLSKIYNCQNAYILVNGSTAGNLSSIYAALKPGEHILIARNCHKSVYHGSEIRSLVTDYVFPKVDELGIPQGIDPGDVKSALDKYGDIKAFVMTSPTYEGINSNIKEIADVCHEKGTILIVDAAHGAHLGVLPGFGKNPVELGADAVVVSLHKTLPMFTMSAALLIPKGSRIDKIKLETGIRIFQTSSPSYIIMSGIDAGLRFLDDQGEKRAALLLDRIEAFDKAMKRLKILGVYENKAKEPSKIVLFSKVSHYDGPDLMKELREIYHLEMEMAVGQYTIAMTTIMDIEEGFYRLEKALLEIDERLSNEEKSVLFKKNSLTNSTLIAVKKKFEIYEAAEMDKKVEILENCEGKISGAEICVYPPGIPQVQPGEVISKEIIEYLKICIKDGLETENISQGNEIMILR